MGKIQPVQFCIGDRVKLAKDGDWGKKDDEGLIESVSYIGDGDFEYSTTWGAWVDHNLLRLVHRATPESFKELDKSIREERESYEGDEDEEDEDEEYEENEDEEVDE